MPAGTGNSVSAQAGGVDKAAAGGGAAAAGGAEGVAAGVRAVSPSQLALSGLEGLLPPDPGAGLGGAKESNSMRHCAHVRRTAPLGKGPEEDHHNAPSASQQVGGERPQE